MRIRNISDHPRYFPYAGSGQRNGINLTPGELSPAFAPARFSNPVLQKDLKAGRIALVCTSMDRAFISTSAIPQDQVELVPDGAKPANRLPPKPAAEPPKEVTKDEVPEPAAAEEVVDETPEDTPEATPEDTLEVESAPAEDEGKEVEVVEPEFVYPDNQSYAAWKKDELNAKLDHLQIPHNPSASNKILADLLRDHDAAQ